MLNLVYYSNVSETTHRLVRKIDITSVTGGNAHRLPLKGDFDAQAAGATDEHGRLQPYILVTPTYGGLAAEDRKRHIQPAVIRFLNNPANRAACIGVIATGNRNFGRDFALAGDILSAKLGVPLLGRIELAGDHEDVALMQHAIREIASRQAVPRHSAHQVAQPITQAA